ncbi:aryl-alcohol dehydrogenase [Diplodia corticola]|uniref:Aryl-alcohol dehydrogenase n=1 Tax=Diplodia corticola TaxID=236234 RepID=A0A1J9QSP6_9PEZI|nr:aryl-alcohol dehydrogenase [Diplodia corticola]OJD31472.1 aryl-alcohol dehydrogenase [Diplodia corticola]
MSSTTYDYVIVGGGTAGLVLAARLSEDPSKLVAVIEAGANRKGDPRIDIPGLVMSLYEDKDYDWSFLTEPQEALNGRQIACPRGRVLGGSSALNLSAILYPSKADFDDWAALNNDQGWNAEAMAPYFRKFHTFRPASEATKKRMLVDYMDESRYGTDGPLNVTIPEGYSPLDEAWVNAFNELGFHAKTDQANGKMIGCFTSPVSIHPDTKTREYSASSYYTEEVQSRPNLHVLTEAVVEKIEWADGAGPDLSASGVHVLQGEEKRRFVGVRSGGEVILSAGTIKSPQILELSGVGNEQLLEKHKIEVKISLPGVGENLQDHVVATSSYEIADNQMSGDNLQHTPGLMDAVMQMYAESRTGPMTGIMLGAAHLPPVDKDGVLSKEALASLVSDAAINAYPDFPGKQAQFSLLRARLEAGEPSCQFLFIPKQINHERQENTMQYLFGGAEAENYVSAVALLNHPFSRGTVHITSADPTAAPAIDPRYLTHPLDLELQARHLQYFEKLVSTSAFKAVLKEGGKRLPPADSADLDTARQIARDRAFTCFHPAGTCAMMPRAQGGVVDSRLRVHGTRNVRVVDASIFPLEPLGNIQASVYAVAEKAADLIKRNG